MEWTCRRGGAGGTVLLRRRSRGNPAVACFTRNMSSLAASFYNARQLSEVVRLENALALSHQRVLLAYTAAHASAGLCIFNDLGGRGSRPKSPLLAQCDNAVRRHLLWRLDHLDPNQHTRRECLDGHGA